VKTFILFAEFLSFLSPQKLCTLPRRSKLAIVQATFAEPRDIPRRVAA
jgi:hypothetical protein